MKFRFNRLDLAFKKSSEVIVFADFTYFHGQMGAGKSTIARLIDFCLGGNLGENAMTPALQTEFVSALLSLEINETPLSLERKAHTNLICARWTSSGEPFEIMIPARQANGVVLPGTHVEVISDLIFHLDGRKPPKVRKSKIKEDSELGRLSLRDLLWYCYLDQDSMDSSFFHLEADGEMGRRFKSRDVLRFIVGFYQEKVSDLETALEELRIERLRCEAGAEAIRDAMSSAEIATESEISAIRQDVEKKIYLIDADIANARAGANNLRTHAMEEIQGKARALAMQLNDVKEASGELRELLGRDKAHKNELLALSSRSRRSRSARAVLNGVDFISCPRCNKQLPERSGGSCRVCGQSHEEVYEKTLDVEAAERDLTARVDELASLIERHESQLQKNRRVVNELELEKSLVDSELDRVSQEYDSKYLSSALEAEKKRAALKQQLLDLGKIEVLARKISDLSERVNVLVDQEKRTRAELKIARDLAERDTLNIAKLKNLFLDCLLRSKLAGFFKDDVVDISSPSFLPEVSSAGSGELAVTSFANLGSGGKKGLFKCCFAIALHRLSTQIGAALPSVLIIDSAMKNISERENREQWEGFHAMLYQLAATELRDTQFILIDKEMYPASDDFSREFRERHMRPNVPGIEPEHNPFPPLIPYYKDK